MSSVLATNPRRFRKEKGWSQQELADRIGAHLTHVSRVETGKYAPSLDFVVNAAKTLEVTMDALLSERENALQDVRIEGKEVAERVRLLESLDKREREALITVIDSMLTKHKMRRLLQKEPLEARG